MRTQTDAATTEGSTRRPGGTPVVAAAAILIGATMASSAIAATIDVATERRGEFVEIRASALVDADAATAWRVLTRYDQYARFIPDLRVSRTVARRGNVVTVEQEGDARLWLLRMSLDVTYEITEEPPDAIRSRSIAGSFRTLESQYRLTRDSSGVRLTYTGRVAPGFALFGPFEELAVRVNVTRQFQALADEMERAAAERRNGVRDATPGNRR